MQFSPHSCQIMSSGFLLGRDAV